MALDTLRSNAYKTGIKNTRPSSSQIRPLKPILIVEGDNDKLFYAKYVNKNKIKVLSMDNNEDKKYIARKFGCSEPVGPKEYIIRLITFNLKNKSENDGPDYKNCYGIVDRDFDVNKIPVSEDLKQYLIETDGRDIETTLLFYDYSNLEQSFKENFNREKGNINILKKAIENAVKIGILRDYCSKNGIETNFGRIEGYDHYNREDACYYCFVNQNQEFDFDSYLNQTNLKSRKISTKLTFDIIQDFLEFCRGHDIFDFIACFYKRAEKEININWKGNSNNKNIRKYRKEAEEFLVNHFDDKVFVAKSPMYKFLCQI